MDLLFDLAWKASATALAIVLVAKLGERGGALLASVAMTFPMNAGPGFFFIALEQSAGFVRQGALVGFAGTGAVLAFVATFVAVARARGFAPGLAAALLAWLALALVDDRAAALAAQRRRPDRARRAAGGPAAAPGGSPRCRTPRSGPAGIWCCCAA